MTDSRVSRSTLTGVGAVAVLVATAAPAVAHVTVSAPNATRTGSAVLVYRVPNESAVDSPTVEFRVQIPGISTTDAEAVPGWTSLVRHDTADDVTVVTWTADPDGGIGPDQFGEFSVLANGLPDADEVVTPAVQTYADGQVMRWDQELAADGDEPEFPAPVLTLGAARSGGTDDHGDIQSAPSGDQAEDSTARWLGGIGIAVGATALIAAVGAAARRGR
ncbi:DUF1775 domain-containing protein [Nocardia sp. CNY236]|uniref:DUF1775 domain-containing protein n=1 Tax=Nocardia sp. CNY236 TaxID=1169152 RepID=UPI0003FF0A13|nr:DUF1775 domain-containing protein [Nocardia sp. CNY236]